MNIQGKRVETFLDDKAEVVTKTIWKGISFDQFCEAFIPETIHVETSKKEGCVLLRVSVTTQQKHNAFYDEMFNFRALSVTDCHTITLRIDDPATLVALANKLRSFMFRPTTALPVKVDMRKTKYTLEMAQQDFSVVKTLAD